MRQDFLQHETQILALPPALAFLALAPAERPFIRLRLPRELRQPGRDNLTATEARVRAIAAIVTLLVLLCWALWDAIRNAPVQPYDDEQ